MHAENFLSSWKREDVENKEERRREVNKETREEVCRRGKKEKGKKGEDETVGDKRRCVNRVSDDASQKFSHGEDSDSCGNSWG